MKTSGNKLAMNYFRLGIKGTFLSVGGVRFQNSFPTLVEARK